MKIRRLLPATVIINLAVILGLAGHAAGAAKTQGAVNIVGSTSVQPLAEELAKAYMKLNPQVRITVAGGGSGAGIKAVREGKAELGSSSRELAPEEETGLTATAIARDGIAVIVNNGNNVAGMSMVQLAKVYSGQTANWKELGGQKAPIVLIGREAGSGTRGAFEELVLGKNHTPAGAMLIQGSTGAVRQTVAITKNAIGYTSMGAVNDSVKALKVNGVQPSEANVLNKTYPLSRPFLLLSKGAPQGAIKSFLDWVLSPAGQAIVAKEFVPVGKTK